MFPERDSFIPNIMKFCGYLNRYTIVKLKNSAEIQKMFDYVVSKAELVEDKKAMFGIFARNPSLLSIPPGTQAILERYLDKIDRLLPKRSRSKSKLQKAARSKDAPNTTQKENVKPTTTVDTLKERLEKWFADELPMLPSINMTIEQAMGTFTLAENPNGGFTWRCQDKSHLPQILQKSKETGKVTISNATRHLMKSCWMSTKPAPSKPTTPATPKMQIGISSFCTKTSPPAKSPVTTAKSPAATAKSPAATAKSPAATAKPQAASAQPPAAEIPKTDDLCTLKPASEDDLDFTKEPDHLEVIDLESSDEISDNDIPGDSQPTLENPTIVKSQEKASKNLLPPAGLVANTDDSGR